MTKNYFFSLTFILITLLFSACKQNNEAEIKKVDELSIVVKSLKSTFETVDFEEVKMARATYTENTDRIKQYYSTDTIEYDFASTLNFYKGIKKRGAKINQHYESHVKNLQLLENQLAKLKLDLENNSIPADSIQSYIEFEEQNIHKLSDDIGTFIEDCNYIMETHEAYAEKVRGFTVAFK